MHAAMHAPLTCGVHYIRKVGIMPCAFDFNQISIFSISNNADLRGRVLQIDLLKQNSQQNSSLAKYQQQQTFPYLHLWIFQNWLQGRESSRKEKMNYVMLQVQQKLQRQTHQ